MSQPIYAVLTGDVIRSSKLTTEELARLPAVFAGIVKQVDSTCGQLQETTKFSIFRGDSFQLLTTPACALKALILLRAQLRKSYPKTLANAVDVRVALTLGTVAHIAPNITESSGEAFTLSGHLLDTLPYSRQSVFGFNNGEVDKELNTALSLADEIIRKWTTSQALLVPYLLSGLNQSEIARQTQNSQPSILRKLQAMGWQGINNFLLRYEEIIEIIAP